MRITALRATKAVVVLAVAAGLAGCATVGARGVAPGDCTPAWPHVSADVARPGDRLTVSSSASTCRLHFDRARRLTLDWVDRAGHRSRLGTVRAHPSGAFERRIRVPAAAAAGPGRVSIGGVEGPCPPNASCAAFAAGITVVRPSTDFSTSNRANHVAADIAERMQKALRHHSALVEVGIVPDGLEAVLRGDARDGHLALVRREFTAAAAAVPADDRGVARSARLHLDFVRHDEAALERLTMHITRDRAWQKRHRIELSEWGPDTATDSVRIRLLHYRDAAALLLVERYGTAITVSTTDTPYGVAL